MLSFQVIQSGNAIQICCDKAGIATLMETLSSLLLEPGHLHLRGPSAGGNDLSETSPFGERAVWEVIIDYSPSN
ncbi:MAG: hypothetical protein ABSD30_02580 [Candidatus Binatus sp.]|jgi:hypothetical protein